MTIHPDFPSSPYEILHPDIRWFPADEALRESSYEKLLPPLVHSLRKDIHSWRERRYEYKAKDDNIFEVLEIKLDKIIDSNMIRVAKEKILKFSPNRYYILSYKEINQEEIEEIYEIIDEVKENHGCQIVINGVIPSLKYYFRLIDNIEDFISIYSELIEKDTELKISHKKKWAELLNRLES